MPNPLKSKTNDKKRPGIPPEQRRIEIALELMKTKHFNAIWYTGMTLKARQFHDGEPDHLGWQEAIDIIEASKQNPEL